MEIYRLTGEGYGDDEGYYTAETAEIMCKECFVEDYDGKVSEALELCAEVKGEYGEILEMLEKNIIEHYQKGNKKQCDAYSHSFDAACEIIVGNTYIESLGDGKWHIKPVTI